MVTQMPSSSFSGHVADVSVHLVVQAEDEELGAVVEGVSDKDDQHGSYDALIAVAAEPPFDHSLQEMC